MAYFEIIVVQESEKGQTSAIKKHFPHVNEKYKIVNFPAAQDHILQI